jgi:D-alanyl-D-alanine carboxypeptidase
MITFPVVLALLGALSIGGRSPTRTEETGQAQQEVASDLQVVLDSLRQAHDGVGVSASVVFPDGSVWTGVSGVSHDSVPMAADMIFGIGSVTKTLTATLTMKLAEEGLLSLADPVEKWLPEFPNIDGRITVKQLLNHTSGVAGFFNNEKIWTDFPKDKCRHWTPEEVLTYVGQPYFPPGESQHYVNTNYLLLGMIIKEAAGSFVSETYRRFLWEPLGLRNMYLGSEDQLPENLAHAFSDIYTKSFGVGNPGVMVDVSAYPRTAHDAIVWTAGGAYATPRDLAVFAHALFTGEILSPHSMASMLDFVEIPGSNEGYGFGVFSYPPGEYADGLETIGHTGQNTGYVNFLVHVPEARLTIVVSANNQDGPWAYWTAVALVKEVLRPS